MQLERIRIKNFKGISEQQEFRLRPITLFIGPNSSGKSSVIHALAAVAQTFRIPNNLRPLVLDDEFADVHLGRFIEVIHSRSYADAISIEIDISGYRQPDFERESNPDLHTVDASASWKLRSTLRTQEVYLEEARYQLGKRVYLIKKGKKGKKGYQLLVDEVPVGEELQLSGVFLDDISVLRAQQNPKSLQFLDLMFMKHKLPEALAKTRYLGPFRQSPRRRYPTRGASPIEVGPEGEATITMLANEAVQHQSRRHITQVSKWLHAIGLGKRIEVQRLAGSDLFDAGVILNDDQRFPIADLGYGVSQVLPVLTQCSFARPEDLLLFEQPELHLHPIAAAKLASVFVQAAKERQVKIVAETHSPELFRGLVKEMREGRLDRRDFVAYQVSREKGRSRFTELVADVDNEVYANWELGLSMPS